jgi:hypothetical protein
VYIQYYFKQMYSRTNLGAAGFRGRPRDAARMNARLCGIRFLEMAGGGRGIRPNQKGMAKIWRQKYEQQCFFDPILLAPVLFMKQAGS